MTLCIFKSKRLKTFTKNILDNEVSCGTYEPHRPPDHAADDPSAVAADPTTFVCCRRGEDRRRQH